MTLFLAGSNPNGWILCIAGCLGLLLSSRFRLRGCLYAIGIFSIAAAFGHCLASSHHLWLIGLEASIACAFFIIAQIEELKGTIDASIQVQMDTKSSAILHLEEEFRRATEEQTTERLAFSAKKEALEKNLEELQSEKSALEILNDVLRKTNAIHYAENKTLASHLKEALKKEECQNVENQKLRSAIDEIDKIKEAHELLKEERDLLQKALGCAEEKIHDLASLSGKYRQLQEQFAEKNQILHNTRRFLFQKEASLETEQINAMEKQLIPNELSCRIEQDLIEAVEIGSKLEEENRLLQEVISYLAKQPPPLELPSLRSNLQAAFGGKKKPPLIPGERSLEETLRDALAPKKKKKSVKPSAQDLLF